MLVLTYDQKHKGDHIMCNINEIRATIQAELDDLSKEMINCSMESFYVLRARYKNLRAIICECYEGNESNVWEMLKYTDRVN